MENNDLVEFSISNGNYIGINKQTYGLLLELAERKDKTVFEVIDELARRETLRLDYEEIQDYGRT